jgi:hypothetical protein
MRISKLENKITRKWKWISVNCNRVFIELVDIKFEVNKRMPEGDPHRAAEGKKLKHFSHCDLAYD